MLEWLLRHDAIDWGHIAPLTSLVLYRQVPGSFHGLEVGYSMFFRFYLVSPGKGKVVPVFFKPSTTQWRRIGGVEVRIHVLFDLGTRWRWVAASRPGRSTPRERAPGTHWIGSWVCPRAGRDAVSKRKVSRPRRDSNPDHPTDNFRSLK
jgi:hypothetical protein